MAKRKKNKKINTNSLEMGQFNSAFNGDKVVVTITGVTDDSDNEKVGNMLGTNIMPATVDNLNEAVKTGNDKAGCGNCPFRPSNYSRLPKWLKDNMAVCYVTVSIDGISSNFNSWLAGRIKKMTSPEQLPNKPVRLGSWGDPAMIPLSAWLPVLAGRAHTGYTHQWKHAFAQPFKRFLQASCGSLHDVKNANSKGWFAYLTVPPGTGMTDFDGVECPHQATQGEVTCDKCLLCDGTKCNVWVYDHGLPYKQRKVKPVIAFGQAAIAMPK
jgi:hypothetical protein